VKNASVIIGLMATIAFLAWGNWRTSYALDIARRDANLKTAGDANPQVLQLRKEHFLQCLDAEMSGVDMSLPKWNRCKNFYVTEK
jgi:hypothetical protein